MRCSSWWWNYTLNNTQLELKNLSFFDYLLIGCNSEGVFMLHLFWVKPYLSRIVSLQNAVNVYDGRWSRQIDTGGKWYTSCGNITDNRTFYKRKPLFYSESKIYMPNEFAPREQNDWASVCSHQVTPPLVRSGSSSLRSPKEGRGATVWRARLSGP